MPKNLLIGAFTNHNWDEIAPFFNSYVQAGFENCDCVMFVSHVLEDTVKRMEASGVIVKYIDERYKNGFINLYRWELYRDYLKEHTAEYDMICTADVRDVIFQKDIFKCYLHNEEFLGLALEDSNLTANFSKTWLTKLFGQEVYESIKDNPVSCNGTVWGTTGCFCKFLDMMTSYIDRSIYEQKISDQNIANYLIYYKHMLDDIPVIRSTNKDGYVMTIGFTDAKNIHTDSAGNVLNSKGEIVAVVHQYDRHPMVRYIAAERFSQGMSFLGKMYLRHMSDLLGRSYCFILKARKNEFIRHTKEVIQRRIHKDS